MSQRTRRVAREIGEVHPIGDKSKLLWERYYAPMQNAAAAMNAAITNTQNMIAAIIIEAEGFSPETHVFDMDKLRIMRRPVAKKVGDNGALQ